MATTRNFVDVIRRKLKANPRLEEAVERESLNTHLAMSLYEARESENLTQDQLAECINSHQSLIARIENAEYDGRSVNTLFKIARALNREIRIEFFKRPQWKFESTTWRVEQSWNPQISTSFQGPDCLINDEENRCRPA
jgi:transcriptional regulator with XRE-family HTH domain